jgi:hypothetical protein
LAGCHEFGDESLGSGSTELVSLWEKIFLPISKLMKRWVEVLGIIGFPFR